MKSGATMRVFLVLSVGVIAAVACTSSLEATAQEKTSLVREIDDSSVGLRWLLLRNTDVPGAPGRLMPVRAARTRSRAEQFAPNASVARRALVIRAGDPLIVEEDSSVVRLRLEAVAMTPAAAGELFKARLRTGVAGVSVIAVGPGCARMAPSFGRQP